MLRPIVVFAALLAGCAIPAGQALAQYYPPYVYRGAPPVALDDDDLYPIQPRDYRAAPPYRWGPGTDPYDRSPRYNPAPRAEADPGWPPRPPAGIYPDEPPPPYASPPGYGRQPYPADPPQRN